MELTTPLGILIIAIAAFVALKTVKAAIRLAMIVLVAVGLYLWFGAT